MNKLSLLLLIIIAFSCTSPKDAERAGFIKISDNNRYFTDESGNPFFWLGDTGWLLFTKLSREEAMHYLHDRKEKGFNVIQVMVLHTLGAVNVYGDSALINQNVSTPRILEGNDFENPEEYDYWDHVEFVIDKAAALGFQMALVPVWGSNVKAGLVSRDEMRKYGSFLAKRYVDKPNVIWLNGGDIFGYDSTATWQVLGETLREYNPDHLITFHPRGRTQSSTWFHNEAWLDFNMFQSGHRRYDQDTTGLAYGEDNWRYAEVDYNLEPVKPTLDSEPSYEGIPQGLHDITQPFWTDKEVRRYAYWSVFAGGAGFTYGHSSVMQMHRPVDEGSAFGNTMHWDEALQAPGAKQMIHLKNLMLSRPYFDRVPAQSLIIDQGERYEYVAATRGESYALAYTYTGRSFSINLSLLSGENVKAGWFNPRDGQITEIGEFSASGIQEFNPPGEYQEGNDWVLILDVV